MNRKIVLSPFVLLVPLLVMSCGGSSGNGNDVPIAATNQVTKSDSSRSSTASSPASSASSAAVTNGRLLASNCFGCHGTDGYSGRGFDGLAGESVSEIVEEMREMRTEDEGIMTIHALGYTDEQVRRMAEYFATR